MWGCGCCCCDTSLACISGTQPLGLVAIGCLQPCLVTFSGPSRAGCGLVLPWSEGTARLSSSHAAAG